MRTRHLVLAVALLVSAGLAAFGDKAPEGAVVESVERPVPVRRAAASIQPDAPRPEGAASVMRLVPRSELIGQAGDDGSVFGTHSWSPPPPEPPPAGPPPPPPPPTAPPIPFTFIGKALGDGRWEVFVAQGERVHAVHAGDIVDGAWRVDTVAPPVMSVTYLPLGQQQQLNIGANE